ncbi:MAG TPA: ribosome small subunit-dependent GTPase A [Prolixibacteraceae bacterium]|nr:MAG: ribosome small subunit-dependent GTPase A [Bacteroidetes bacterium GWB2_41_8]HCY40625.1 ribosome small subunit-dependent GTPase A [Prolixibacteraceae bacterium]
MKKGIVIKSTGSWYTVKTDDGNSIECRIKGNFRIKGIRSTNPIAVGDHVEITEQKEDNNSEGLVTGLITNIIERKNYIIRKSPNLSKESHIIAANIDQAFLIVTIKHPVTTTTFIDRFLVSAEAYRIPCRIIFNKTDLYDEEQTLLMNSLIDIYEAAGYKCLKISAKKNIGIEELKLMIKDKTNVLSGHSGVGKSTIINSIQPGLMLKTGIISDSHHSGKHTTTYSEMIDLDFGGFIIDTPGIKGFGLLEMVKEEISHYFPEMFQLLNNCQYYNCTHTHEPGCAVKKAVTDGQIAESRYDTYVGLLNSEEKYRN